MFSYDSTDDPDSFLGVPKRERGRVKLFQSEIIVLRG